MSRNLCRFPGGPEVGLSLPRAEAGWVPRKFNWPATQSSMFVSFSASSKSDRKAGRRKSPFRAVCFFPAMWRTLKSNNRIHASHLVIRAPGKSVADLLSLVTSALALVSRISQIPYTHSLIFFSILSSLRGGDGG